MKRHTHDGGKTWHEHGPGEPWQLLAHEHEVLEGSFVLRDGTVTDRYLGEVIEP